MKLKLALLCLGLMLISSFAVSGQTGTIRTLVIDDETGETLIGANVLIDGTMQGSITDLDGVAMINNLNPSTYNIKVSYISYQTTTISDVNVEPNKVNSLTIRLKSVNFQINEVVITAKEVKNREAAILTLQKKSPKVFDAISADQFAKVGVSDAAGALKKVTGVTITSGKYVYVRGLGDRYSKSNLNGAEIPSLDPNKNALQLDLFPTNLIDNIIVYKTFTPDLQGDFAGGLIDISTKDFPESFKLQLSLELEYNTQASFNSNFLAPKGSTTDFLGYDNGFRALPSQISRYSSSDFPDPYLDKTGITEVSRAFDNREFDPGKKSQFMNHSLSFSVGDQVQLFKKPLGYILGLSYKRRFFNYEDGIQSVYEGISQGQTTLNNDILTSSTEQKSVDNVLMGAMFNTSYKLNNNNKISLSLLGNQSGSSEARYQVGYLLDASPDSSTRLQNRVINYVQRSFFNVNLRGEHIIPSLNKLNISWMNSYSTSSYKQPDLRLIRNQFTINDSGDTLYYLGNVDRPSRFYRDLNEINNNSKLDLTLPVKMFGGQESKIKVGGYYLYKNRSFRENIYQYNIQTNKNFDGDISAFFLDENLGWVDNQLRNYLININIDANNYNANQQLFATYAMLESQVMKKLKVIAGVRFEKTNMEVRAFNDTTGIIQTNDFLPSLALTYLINDKTNLRASANRTLARPSFREFAPLATYDFLGGYIQNGNPYLERTLINNFDLRWEKFPQPGEYISASLFYKKFLNPIENTQLPRAGGSTSQFQYKNEDESNLFGFELEFRKNLAFIAQALRNFKMSANFTYVYSYVYVTPEELTAIQSWNPDAKKTRPMYNQAPYSFNANLSYENPDKGWESTLSFNVSGKRMVVYQIDLPSIYLQPMPDLNFTVKKTFSDRITLLFKAKNILNSTYKEQMLLNDNIYYTTKYQMGRSFSLSFVFNLSK